MARAGERGLRDQLFAIEEEVPKLIVGVVRDVRRVVLGEDRRRICRGKTERKANIVIITTGFCLFVAGMWMWNGRTVWMLWRRRRMSPNLRRRRRMFGGVAGAGIARAPPTNKKAGKVLVCSR